MTVIGILFEKRIVDDSGFPRTPDRPVEFLGTRVRYPRSVKTTIGACGPDSLGGSATVAALGRGGTRARAGRPVVAVRPSPCPRKGPADYFLCSVLFVGEKEKVRT